jgi:hypothetical protein
MMRIRFELHMSTLRKDLEQKNYFQTPQCALCKIVFLYLSDLYLHLHHDPLPSAPTFLTPNDILCVIHRV